MGTSGKEFISLKASQMLHQDELVALIKARFPETMKPVGRLASLKGAETVEVRVPLDSPRLEEIRNLIMARREQRVHGYADYSIGRYVRKYSAEQLRKAEVLRLSITSHFEPCGEECGTIYETLCPYCNLGKQSSDLILDLQRVPTNKDISESISWVEWIVSSRFKSVFAQHRLQGAEFSPIFSFKDPITHTLDWHQLKVSGRAGEISERTLLGRDPFSPSEISWRCPLGHSLVAQFLSEVYLHRGAWDGSDIAITTSRLGQGRNLLRPTSLIFISQRAYRLLQQAGLKGYSVEVAHLV